jgi:hypothetical protein
MNLIEVEKSSLLLNPVCHVPGIWACVLFEDGQFFPWFRGFIIGEYQAIGSLSIDGFYYTKVDNYEDLNYADRRFCQVNNILYIRADENLPLWLFYFPKYNSISGYTDDEPFVDPSNRVFYRTGVDYVPAIKDQADNLEYAALKLKSENIKFINASGEYDSMFDYFGNTIRVIHIDGIVRQVASLILERAEGMAAAGAIKRERAIGAIRREGVNGTLVLGRKELAEFYIKNIKVKAKETTFVCGDKREKLQGKVPGRAFTKDQFGYIDSEYIGETMPDVYGHCTWIECFPVDTMRIYNPNGAFRRIRTFYVARSITKLEIIDTRQYIPDPNPVAVMKYKPNPNYGLYLENYVWVKKTSADGYENWVPQPVNIAESDFEHGILALNISACMPPLPSSGAEGWGTDLPDIYPVYASGHFQAPDTPLAIIKDLIAFYCRVPYDSYSYNITEIEAEIGALSKIGVVFNGNEKVFDCIAKLQNSSDYGFQFKSEFNRFTARRDDNERPISAVITRAEIVDIASCSIDMNATNYATIIDVSHQHDYMNGTDLHIIDERNRPRLLLHYEVDKTYADPSLLKEEADARRKADYLTRFFSKTRFSINDVQVVGHPDLKVYDIVTVDLRIERDKKEELGVLASLFGSESAESLAFGEDLPVNVIPLDIKRSASEDYERFRDFGGVLTCKVMSVELDLKTMTNKISLLEVGS